MKIWVNNSFKGFYPVGTAAVVIAESKHSAKTYLDTFLAAKGLNESDEDDFREMNFEDGEVKILCDGEY